MIILKNNFSVRLTDGEFLVYFEYGDSESALRIPLKSYDLFHLHIAYLYTLKCYVTSSLYFCLQHVRLTCSLYRNLVCHYADLINNTLTAYQEIDAGCHLKSTFLYSPLGCPNVSECRKRWGMWRFSLRYIWYEIFVSRPLQTLLSNNIKALTHTHLTSV